jgi:hypothetical protein
MNGPMDEEFSLSRAGSVTILNEETAANENKTTKPISTTSSETSSDGILLQTQIRTSSPSIFIQSKLF